MSKEESGLSKFFVLCAPRQPLQGEGYPPLERRWGSRGLSADLSRDHRLTLGAGVGMPKGYNGNWLVRGPQILNEGINKIPTTHIYISFFSFFLFAFSSPTLLLFSVFRFKNYFNYKIFQAYRKVQKI